MLELPRNYRLTATRRMGNTMMVALLRLGLGPKHNYLLTTRGRKTGRLHTTPVTLVEEDGQRWLVAPSGVVGWVRNVRASGEATLGRGRRSERVRAEEVDAPLAAPVLKRYLQQEPIVRPFFDVEPDSDIADFAAEASRHPVFAVTPVG